MTLKKFTSHCKAIVFAAFALSVFVVAFAVASPRAEAAVSSAQPTIDDRALSGDHRAMIKFIQFAQGKGKGKGRGRGRGAESEEDRQKRIDAREGRGAESKEDREERVGKGKGDDDDDDDRKKAKKTKSKKDKAKKSKRKKGGRNK
ncbi:MAG: hypothetical protein QF393_04140 [Rhodospirillales bacterium]|jgi:hypothetical protein|nr:hypothetical protein [Rhodospirillaceae bacterium]MDP6427184.1 hypothetical protein [Rhodospirillales bacterium]MDP6646578.1 hypothetical protein [Rhodospirillales bacterium]|tara:strand:+ start:369 stop:806 length:438 start_codon:yes stop_codon:yes gene_type:complete